MLPKIPYERRKNKNQSIPMRSINLGSAAEVGELSDSCGISTRKFPYLTTRRGDAPLEDFIDKNVMAMTVFNGNLVTVRNDGYYVGDTKIEGLDPDGAVFAPINSKLVVYPDKKYIEKDGESSWKVKDLEAEIKVARATFAPSSIAITEKLNSKASGQGCTIEGENFSVSKINQIYKGNACLTDCGSINKCKISFFPGEANFTQTIEFQEGSDKITFYQYFNENENEKEKIEGPVPEDIHVDSVIYIQTGSNLYSGAYVVKEKQDNYITVRKADGSDADFQRNYSCNSHFFIENNDKIAKYLEDNIGKAINIKLKGDESYRKYWLQTASPSPGYELYGQFDGDFQIQSKKLVVLDLFSTGWGRSLSSLGLSEGTQVMLISDSTGFPISFTVKECAENHIIATNTISESTIQVIPGKEAEGIVELWTISNDEEVDLSALKEGDAVSISGSKTNDISFVIDKISTNAIHAQSEIFTSEEFSNKENPVYITRKAPTLDFMCEKDNRLYGVNNKDKTIYVSALGDPTNMFAYEGVSTDSFAVAVGGEGDFTACCKYGDAVLFFKEDKLYKLVGSYPAEFALYSYDVTGVATGSEKSCVVINEVLYYMGLDGVYAYTGGIPTLISTCFGEHRFKNGVGGTDGRYYYLSVEGEDDKPYLFTYDTRTQLWIIEQKIRCIDFARTSEGLHYVSGGSVYRIGAEKTSGEWLARWAPIYELIDGKRSYSRILLRVSLPRGSYIKIRLRFDGGEWRNAGTITGKTENVMPLRIPINRCDKFELELSGRGECTILDIMREYYVGSEV